MKTFISQHETLHGSPNYTIQKGETEMAKHADNETLKRLKALYAAACMDEAKARKTAETASKALGEHVEKTERARTAYDAYTALLDAKDIVA